MKRGQDSWEKFKTKYTRLVRWIVYANPEFYRVKKYYDFIVEDSLEDSYSYIEENDVEFPKALVVTIATRTVIRYIREANAQMRKGYEKELSGNEGPSNPDAEKKIMLKQFFKRLTKVQQKYCLLFSEFSVQEIAEREGYNVGSVHQMRAKIRQMLKEYIYDEL